jgi:5'-AMP-activated protein kinase catalytic alpha subunit
MCIFLAMTAMPSLLVDPLKRITISEIRLHPWFVVHLPRYLAVPPPDTLAQATNVDAETLEMVVNLGREPPLALHL